MKKLCENNKNSVKFYESFEIENEFAIVMELCDESLRELIKHKVCDIREIYKILYQLNNTFKLMRENKIVHRDLKPENILIKYEENNQYKVNWLIMV